MNFLLNMGLTLVVVVGAYRVDGGASEPGKIVAFLSYFMIMLHAVMAITRVFIVLSRATASTIRIEEVLDTEEDLEEKEIEATKSRYHIEFDNVCFSYAKESCITDVSFGINKGESLGIIGSTGSGKTTLIYLMMRFYDFASGSIRIDGEDIRSFDKQVLRKKFGVAFQNDVLFADSIYENINLGRKLTKEQVKDATIDAQAASFINEYKEKLDFKLSIKGSNLSGGQKQRLLIARALAGNPEILILDDSSSALDYKTDSMLRKAIREKYKDTTSIIIAQRISSVMKLDNIHNELMEKKGFYYKLYHSQFE